MSTPGKLTKKQRQELAQAKTSITSPYKTEWSPLSHQDRDSILTLLKDQLTAISLEKKEVKVERRWGRKKEKKISGDNSVNKVHQENVEVRIPPDKSSLDGENPSLGGLAPDKSGQCGWTNESARRQLAIGINEVTKALERNQLSLVLVCQSARPSHMTKHLIGLSRTREVPACQVPQLSDTVSGVLGLRSVLALGFRRNDGQDGGPFSDLVFNIILRVPRVRVDWLPEQRAGDVGGGEAGLHLGEQDGGKDEGEGKGEDGRGEDREGKGQKRKIDDVSPESASCSYQRLKVKRIIANPARKHKPKKKK